MRFTACSVACLPLTHITALERALQSVMITTVSSRRCALTTSHQQRSVQGRAEADRLQRLLSFTGHPACPRRAAARSWHLLRFKGTCYLLAVSVQGLCVRYNKSTASVRPALVFG